MNIRKLFMEIKEELDTISYFREKIIYPESPLDKIDNLKREKEEKNR